MTAPQWAQELILKALIEFRPDGEIPELKWRRANRKSTSGIASARWIHITAGRDRTTQRLVLLHELAHVLTADQLGCVHHDSVFWDMAWKLYRWAKLPIRYCLKSEGNYRRGAVTAYKRTVKP